ncbi:MAG: glutamate racemase [Vampirovibrionales bacterium]|nr:glutamate racemase [Vampirovibrionales bacterium]
MALTRAAPLVNSIPSAGASRPIAVFDSGVGGLSVLDALAARYPRQTFHYLGDTFNMPYGEKTPDALLALIAANLRWARDAHDAKLAVFACNSSTGVLSVCDLPQKGGPWPRWIGPAEPACRAAVARGYQRIATLATPTTVQTGLYRRVLHRLNPSVETLDAPAQGLADCIEKGQTKDASFAQAMAQWLRPVIEFVPDAVILGCTHYPFVADIIADMLPPDVALVDPADSMADAIASWAETGTDAETEAKTAARVTFSVTGDPQAFARVARQLPLRHLAIDAVQRVDVASDAARPEAITR